MGSSMAPAVVALLLIIIFGAAASTSASAAAGADVSADVSGSGIAKLREAYDLWLARHGRAYSALGEYERRFRVFLDNLAFVRAHNAKADATGAGEEGEPPPTFRLGMNNFADLTNAEYRAAFLSTSLPEAASSGNGVAAGERYFYNSSGGLEAPLPGRVDWRAKGAVAPIKNQGQCGSCWAFSAVAAVEGVNKIFATGAGEDDAQLVTLSEQELVDCARNGQNSGCGGGLMDDAFAFIAGRGGIATDADYPYRGKQSKCDTTAMKKKKAVSINGFERVPAGDELSLKKAVAGQPVSVAIEAGGREFQLYDSGVFTGRCGTELDHGVVAVGYGADETTSGGNKEYWLVRNSWGAQWGEGGYIRMERNVRGSKSGKCGIAMAASYPVKTTPNPPEPAPEPETTKCDRHSTCPAGSTCCCAYGVRRACLAWGCCPAQAAVCCRDRDACCTADHPVCGGGAGKKRTCSSSRNATDVVDALPRTPAARQWSPVSELADLILSM